MSFCYRCGSKLGPADRHCGNCGAPVKNYNSGSSQTNPSGNNTFGTGYEDEIIEPEYGTPIEPGVPVRSNKKSKIQRNTQENQYDNTYQYEEPYQFEKTNPYEEPYRYEEPYQYEDPQRPQDYPKVSGKKAGLIIGGIVGGIVLIGAIGIGVYAFVNRAKTIDVQDLISLDCSGYDGYGTVTINCDELTEEIRDKAKTDSSEAVDMVIADVVAQVAVLNENIENNGNISNGDKIKLDLDLDESLAESVKIKYEDLDFKEKVDGLEEITEYDPFEEGNYYLSFDGYSPDGTVTIEGDSDAELELEYLVDGDTSADGVAIGDKLKLSVESPDSGMELEEYAARLGYELTDTESTYKVTSKDLKKESSKYQKEDGIIFPNSSEKELTASQCAGLSSHEVQCAINEIYARHGYIFEEDGWDTYYFKYDWYEPTIPKSQFSQSLLNSIEKANIELLSKYR